MPAAAKLAGMTHALHFWGDRGLPPEPSEWKASCLAPFDVWHGRGQLLLALRHEAAWHLAAALAGGWLRYLLLWGPPLKRGETLGRSVEFKRTIDLGYY